MRRRKTIYTTSSRQIPIWMRCYFLAARKRDGATRHKVACLPPLRGPPENCGAAPSRATSLRATYFETHIPSTNHRFYWAYVLLLRVCPTYPLYKYMHNTYVRSAAEAKTLTPWWPAIVPRAKFTNETANGVGRSGERRTG